MKKIKFLPNTIFGKWSLVLIVLMPVCFFIGGSLVTIYESIPAGNSILEDITTRPGVALPMLAGMISGIAAFFTGMIGIVKQKDRSVLIFFSTIIGALMLLFIIAEIIFPH